MLKFQKWLKKEVQQLPSGSIVHACDFDTASPVYRICKKNNLKFIYDIFDYYVESHNLPFPLNKLIETKDINIINNSDAVVICTEQRKEQIKKANPKNLYIIHNTPNIENVEKKDLSSDGNIKVAFIGSLGADRLIGELLNEIPKHTKYSFYFGGLGVFDKDIITSSQINQNIKYLGAMKYQDVLNYEASCDVLFATYNPDIPNHKFSAPNKFYEAGALSKPIIVCKNTGVDSLVEENQTGLICEYSATSFFETLDKLSSNKDLMMKLGENGNVAYNNKFSWDIMANRIKEMYENLLKNSQ